MRWRVPIYIDVPALRPGTIGACVFALLAAGVAAALRIAIDPYVTGVQYITFFPAVVITALISGLGAGLLCVVLSAGAAVFFFLHPRWSFYVESPAEVVDLLLFILEAIRGISSASSARWPTLKASTALDDFKPVFQERLGVLARAHGLLFRMKEGERVTFDRLIGAELSAHSACVRSVDLDGSNGARLRSSTVQTLALALHELMTNAVKYGALKQPNGRLAVRWRLETFGEGGKPWLHLDWKESGVEMASLDGAPQGTGRGRDLIEQALPTNSVPARHFPWNRMAFVAPFRFPSPNADYGTTISMVERRFLPEMPSESSLMPNQYRQRDMDCKGTGNLG
jgi:two-component sensor histidine kinase